MPQDSGTAVKTATFPREQHTSYGLQGFQVSSTAVSRTVNRLPVQLFFYIAVKMPDLCKHYGPSVFDAIRK